MISSLCDAEFKIKPGCTTKIRARKPYLSIYYAKCYGCGSPGAHYVRQHGKVDEKEKPALQKEAYSILLNQITNRTYNKNYYCSVCREKVRFHVKANQNYRNYDVVDDIYLIPQPSR